MAHKKRPSQLRLSQILVLARPFQSDRYFTNLSQETPYGENMASLNAFCDAYPINLQLLLHCLTTIKGQEINPTQKFALIKFY